MQNSSGFTLLELVISITILVLILGVILGAMRLGSRSWEVEEKRVDRLQRMRVTFDIISEDIKSIVSGPAQQGKKCICPACKGCPLKVPLFIGENNRIKFVSANTGLDRRLSKSRYRVVSYFLGQDYGADYEGVMMEEQMWLFPDFFRFDAICDMCDQDEAEIEYDTYTHIVYPEVRELTFRYYGVKNRDEEPDWYETWNSLEELCSCDVSQIRDSLPQKVEIRMLRPAIMAREADEDTQEVIFEVPIEAHD